MASINVGSSRGSIATVIGVLIFIIAIIVIWKRNPNFLSGLFGGGGGMIGAAVGDTKPGPNIYPVVGDIPRSGDFGRSDANSGTSFRDNVSFPCDKCARETTWFFTPGTGGGGSTGEDLTVKMGSHGGESDQTSLIGFGSIPLTGSGGKWKSEGPHGNDGDVVGDINEGSVKLSGDQPMGIKGISWNKGGNIQHHEIGLVQTTEPIGLWLHNSKELPTLIHLHVLYHQTQKEIVRILLDLMEQPPKDMNSKEDLWLKSNQVLNLLEEVIHPLRFLLRIEMEVEMMMEMS